MAHLVAGEFPELGKTDGAALRTHRGACVSLRTTRQMSGIPTSGAAEGILKRIGAQVHVAVYSSEGAAGTGRQSQAEAAAHYLSFVNHFAKFDRQVRVGLIPMPPIELFRSECEQDGTPNHRNRRQRLGAIAT